MNERRLRADEDAEPTILSSLKDASKLRTMTLDELTELAAEIRTTLRRLSERRSVHFASNMGVVELTLALHSVFDFTRDRLIWDVGHQCYPHKLITGRFDRIDTIRAKGGLSGYPNPRESLYDLFMTGHAGSSVGTALGLSCGDALVDRLFASKGGDSSARSRCSIAVVGDGAFTSGSIFEALNHAGELQQKLLVVLNDNEMSICKRVGGFGRYLDHMRIAPGYLGAKWRLRQLLEKTPAYGFLSRSKDALKAWLVGGALFEDFGFRYIGPIDGHNVATLRKYFLALQNYDAPILLHILTEKGRGYRPAEIDPSQYHSTSPAKIQKDKRARTAEQKASSRFAKRFPILRSSVSRFNDETDLNLKSVSDEAQPFTFWVKDAILNAMRNDPRVCVIVAAMTQGNMLERAREEFPDRFFDVGICEAHAVNFAAGLAKAGMRPIVDVYSGFMQRAYDQLFQETSLQNLPIIFSLDRAGLVGADGATHHGVFDLSYFRPFPNIESIAPGDALDVGEAFKYALSRSNPVAIRYPKANVDVIKREVKSFACGKAEVLREGKNGYFAVCGGGILQTALEVAERLANSAKSVDFGVINARFAKPIDAETILRPLRDGKALVAVEENALIGGFGSAILEAANDEGVDARALVRCGVPDLFIEHGTREEELKDAGLDREGLTRAALRALERVEKLKGRSR